MPGPMTHYIFYKKLKDRIIEQGGIISDNFELYSNFAQGHDLLMFQNYFKIFTNHSLENTILMSKLFQEYSFVDFVFLYLNNAEKKGLLQDEVIRYFLLYGYISHHILDAYTHPLIIYFCGDHIRTKSTKEWKHGIAENLIDAWLIEKEYGVKAYRFNSHILFKFQKSIFHNELIELLNCTTEQVYNLKNAGVIFKEGCLMMYTYMRHLQYDPTGIRAFLLDIIEHFAHGANAYSYHRDISEVSFYINEEHELWKNPMFPEISSTSSFSELFEKALNHTAEIIINMENLINRGNITKQDLETILPNIASTHGQECGTELIIKIKK